MHASLRFSFLGLCIVALTSGLARAESIPTIKERLKTVDDLEARQVITREQADGQRNFYLGQAAAEAGHPMTRKQVDEWSALRRFLKVINLVYVVAGVIAVASLGWLFVRHILPGLWRLGPAFWELVIYGGGVALMFATGTWWLALPGCLVFGGGLILTAKCHPEAEKTLSAAVISAICAVVWSAVAIYLQSAPIAFLAVMAFESCLGFSVLVAPLCIGIGFSRDDVMPRATFASFVLLVAGLFLKLGLALPAGTMRWDVASLVHYLAPFENGLIFVGTFVYFTGLIIMSSKWYADAGSYAAMQVITVASGVAAVYLGTVYGISPLQGVSGTFFAIWLLEKYIEVSWKNLGVALSMFGLALLLYGLAYIAQRSPQYFLVHLSF